MEELYRHPPFDPRRLNPKELDPVKGTIDRDFGANLRIETEEGWFVERRGLDAVAPAAIEDRPYPSVVKAQREGWFLEPRTLHRRLRRMVDGVAALMLLTLLYLALAPGFDALDIPTIGTESVRLGLLDYPLLGLIVVPLILLPLVLRLTANVGDLRRQSNIIGDEELTLTAELDVANSVGATNVVLGGTAQKHAVFASLQCGVLAPRRHHIMNALGRSSAGQPPPGMTTALVGTEPAFGDGTGVGEESPMGRHDWPGDVYLRPMRLAAHGAWAPVVDGCVEVSAPDGPWPGTLYDALVRIHWEIVVACDHPIHGRLLHVTPVRTAWPDKKIPTLVVSLTDGRAEHAEPAPTR
ncbi:MAG: hypothetical protein CMB11_09170 [Euryarchaeota archaeon]|nr:hypothetical protein [Euryarchaeota archaeon]